jgi:hypothetical protein
LTHKTGQRRQMFWRGGRESNRHFPDYKGETLR